ncbi:MAG: hypothetical protein ACREI9_14560, partial [Nitrospiraceae bacterium]
DETTGLVRISIVADPVPTQDLTLPDAGSEPVPANNETLPEILTSPGSDVQVGSPSGLIIEPQDAPFVDDEEEALAAMTAAILEEE